MKIDWEEVGIRVVIVILVFGFGYQLFATLFCGFHTMRDLGVCPAPHDPSDILN